MLQAAQRGNMRAGVASKKPAPSPKLALRRPPATCSVTMS